MLILEKMNIEDYYSIIEQVGNDNLKIPQKRVKKVV